MATGKTNSIIPFVATHPGTLIRDELEFRDDLTQKELAILLGVKPSFLNEIIKGKRPITASMALLLEGSLEIPADYWMRFQAQYEIDCARITEKNRVRAGLIESWKTITKYVPTKLFAKMGYLTEDLKYNISTIHSIYGVQSTAELANQFSGKKFHVLKKDELLWRNKKEEVARTAIANYEAGRIVAVNCKSEVAVSKK